MGKIFFILLRFIRSSKLLTRYIWGIKIDSNLHETFWDLTTLVLRKEILTIKNKIKYLDMGCGQFAILGQFFKMNNLNSEVTSVDIYNKFVSNSIKNSLLNGNVIKIKKSNLFSNINNKFDLISFNPPYVPFSNSEQRKIKFKHIRYSSSEGTMAAENFLKDAKKYLTKNGEILLGMNTFYVSEKKCIKLIKLQKFKIKKITKMIFNTSVVFKIKLI